MIELHLDKRVAISPTPITLRVGDQSIQHEEFVLYQNGDYYAIPENAKVMFEGNLYNGQLTSGECEILDRSKGKVKYTFSSGNASVEGAYKRAYLRVYKSDIELVSSENIRIIVLENADLDNGTAEAYENRLEKKLDEFDDKLLEVDSAVTTAKTDIAALSQGFNELRNDMKLSEGWSWSADGTDRFTREYPGENYILNSKTGKEKLANAGWDDAYAYLSETINGNSGEFEVGFDLVILDEIAENKKIDITLQTKGGGLPIQIIFPYRIITINPNQTIHITNKFTADYSTITTSDARIVAKFGGASAVKVRLDNFYLKCASQFPENWTPAPSEDYENAYPQYRGLALLPSDNPADYVWEESAERIKQLAQQETDKLKGEVADIQNWIAQQGGTA